MAELVDLGASGLDERTNAVWVQCKGAPVSDEDAPDFGRAPFMCALGVSARPAPATQAGSAQGVLDSVAGVDGVCYGGHDPRASNVFGQIKDGETALHSTGEGYDARVLCKDQMLAQIVGDDHVIVIDRKNGQIVLNCPGGAIKISKSDGIVLADDTGNAGIQITGGMVSVFGQVVLGGRNPVAAVAMVPPQVGLTTTGTGIPVPAAPGVFIGAIVFLLTLALLFVEA
jgi:hypothetical protein